MRSIYSRQDAMPRGASVIVAPGRQNLDPLAIAIGGAALPVLRCCAAASIRLRTNTWIPQSLEWWRMALHEAASVVAPARAVSAAATAAAARLSFQPCACCVSCTAKCCTMRDSRAALLMLLHVRHLRMQAGRVATLLPVQIALRSWGSQLWSMPAVAAASMQHTRKQLATRKRYWARSCCLFRSLSIAASN